MAILCYVTDQIQYDVTTHGIAKDDLKKFAANVEKRQSLAGFDHFPPPCLVKKKIFGFNYRMIAAEKLVGDHLVVVFLRLVVRGGNEYADLQRDPSTWVTRSFEAEIDDGKLSAWVQQRTEKEPPPPAPILSETEETFLWSSAYSEQNEDVLVCETHEWVESVGEPRIKRHLVRLPVLILQAIDRPAGEVQVLRSAEDSRLAIMAFNVPDTHQCVLLSVSYSESDEQLQANGAIWSERLGSADADTVLRYSRRSYPSLLCCDDGMWQTVQEDPQANLALSPEEAEILRSSSLADPQRSAFPLFINGRAGSGKSTLLQYLFEVLGVSRTV